MPARVGQKPESARRPEKMARPHRTQTIGSRPPSRLMIKSRPENRGERSVPHLPPALLGVSRSHGGRRTNDSPATVSIDCRVLTGDHYKPLVLDDGLHSSRLCKVDQVPRHTHQRHLGNEFQEAATKDTSPPSPRGPARLDTIEVQQLDGGTLPDRRLGGPNRDVSQSPVLSPSTRLDSLPSCRR